MGRSLRRTGLTERVARSLREYRAGEVTHGLVDLVRQRVFGLLGGYADGNDAARLRDEPTLRLLLERALSDPEDALASQPTLSRFENGLTRGSLLRWGQGLVGYVLRQQRRRRKRVRRITLDLDPTDDLAHGQQHFSFFNTHYGGRCGSVSRRRRCGCDWTGPTRRRRCWRFWRGWGSSTW